MTLLTKRVFGVFCFQEQKTVLENIKQTGPKVLFYIPVATKTGREYKILTRN